VVSDPGNPLGDAWDDVPLFRELERVLRSSTGPVNWELARQVGIAAAIEGREDPTPTDDDRRGFEEGVRLAELQVAGFTGLDPPNDVAEVEAVRRAEWVQRNLEELRPLVGPAAAKLGEAVDRAQREALGEAATEQGPGLAQVLAQLSPLLLGAQVGGVLGTLATQVLGRYDIALPRPDGARSLTFVVANIAAFERDWSLEPTEFRTWVALHEVAHRFEFSRAWTLEHLRALLDDYLSTLRIDLAGMQRRLEAIDPTDPASLQDALASGEGLFGSDIDDEQRLKLRRIEAFMGAVEGYGDHVTHALGTRLLAGSARIEEAMRRYREGERVDPVLERMLGIEIDRERYRLGRRFCDTVAERTDETTLARMWDDAEALPSLPELEEPALWLSRTV
jgi:putative hydrolase